MNVYLKKITSNPFYYFNKFINNFINLLKFPFRIILFKKINITTFISNNASVINHNKISIGPKTKINTNVILWPTNLIIGKCTQINPGTAIYGNVKIGNYVMIAPNCMIAGGNHNFSEINRPISLQGSNEKGIIINDNVWIGANTVILDGVTIGEGTIIGAGSVVTKDLNSNSIYFGNPAILLRER